MTTLQVYAHRLSDPNLAPGLKVTIANELRDQVEIFQTLEYPRFLATLIPVFIDILQNGNPVFQSNIPEQKLRNIILEIIHRLPQTEALKGYAPDLCRMLMHLLKVENEDNAVVCVKIIIDLHRTYRELLEDQVQPFLDIVQEIFKNMEQTVKDMFDAPSTPIGSATPGINPLLSNSPRPNSPPATELPEMPPKPLQKSMFSFKVLTECPIITVLLFQTHRRYATENIIKFVPLIFQILSLQAKPQAEAASAAQARGEVFVGVSSEIKNRSVYNDFIVAQVKTMSFLAYILRSYTAFLRPFQNQIPEFVLRLLRECPPESSATRKELLVATRHILSTDFRTSFVSKIDLLLNEKVLIGTGVTSYDTLRPLAYSMLADLVHHIRSELSPSQLRRTVYMYTRNLHDPTLAPSIQTMCGKLLLNLIDCIIKIPNRAEGRGLLMRILDAFAHKFATLNMQFKSCLNQHNKKNQKSEVKPMTETKSADDAKRDTSISIETIDDEFDFDSARSIHTASYLLDPQQDGIKDGRFLFKNLTIGLKPLFIGLRHSNSPPTNEINPQYYAQFARGFSENDVYIFIRLFRESLKCFEYYNIDHYYSLSKNKESTEENSIGANELSLKIGTKLSTEEEIMDTLSIVYTLLDPAVFQEIFASQMEFFFDRMLINTDLVHIVQNFLMNEISSHGFTSILLRFLIDRLDHLGGEDVHYSALMLHLFRLAFMAINLFPDANEQILQPYLANLVTSCFKLSSKAKEPANYFLLLRALFKSIGGGRFELLYKEIHPLLQVLLENLNSLLVLAHRTDMRNLFVELCLAVPVRLSALLPFLPYLMRPLVIALQADNELVTQGLRTLELCHDNLNPEFLNQIMAPVMQELMNALWKHVKPLPYNQQHSHIAMRILGKLGGKNRRIFINPPELNYNTCIESGISVEIVFDPNSTPQALSLDKCLEIACKTLEKHDADIFYKKHAYEFLKANIILMLDLDEGPTNLAQSLYQRVKRHLLQTTNTEKVTTKDKVKQQQQEEEEEESKDIETSDKEEEADKHEGENTIVGNTLKKHGLKPERFVGNGYTKYQAKRVAQEEALCTMLVTIMKATILPEIADDAQSLFENICRHFILLHIGEAIEAKETDNKPLSDMMDEKLSSVSLNTTILVDAIVKVITSLDLELRKRAEESVLFCYNFAVKILGSKEFVWQLPIFRVFASQFSACCYKQEWFIKHGGCLGISIISSQMDMGTKWMREHEIEFIRSLLFVLKDASPEMANANTAEATQTLAHVLKVCNGIEGDESPEAQQLFQTLIGLLLAELSNSNKTVREIVQSSFQLLADLTGNEVTELLAPVRERLLAPIFAKPLRALPFAMQIGHIDAITYCLTLRPPFLEFNDELIRLLHEALAIADAEDQALVSRSSQYKNASSLINLRIVCIKLLSAAMACSDFTNQRQSRTCTRIIQVFFKSLYSKSPEVVDAAHRGLKQVLAQQYKLPKELLQQGLRPILTTLSNYKTLSVAGLEGLARLLELLTNYFKVEIGNKLLDHLRQWADPAVLHEVSEKNLYENHEVKIIVAILNIFHLLPAAAHIFLDGLVSAVIDMEGHLRRSISSPFRPNLIKYLNRYPAETIAYFYEHLDHPRHNRLFIDILAVETAGPLRDEVIKSLPTLIEKTLGVTDNPAMHFQGIRIVHEIAAYDSEWLRSSELMESLLRLWRSPSRFEIMKRDDDQGLQMTHESMYLAQIFISYLRVNPDDMDVIYEIATLFAHESVMDLAFLREFFLRDIALGYSAKRKRLILERFLQQYNDASVTSHWRMMILRHVVNPALLVALFQASESCVEIFDTKIIEQLDLKIWKQLGTDLDQDDQYAEDSLRIELLQLTAMIVQYAPQYVTDLRKEIIKFGWHYLRLEDATCKQAAYVLIARFITAFETPSKIVIQIYAALLRAHSSEARPLVKQGLDIITPVLPKRVPLVGNEKIPTWIRLTRKVVVEDTHSIAQMVNVYQLLVRHSDMFYEYQEHFLPQIVNALPKLGLLQNATPENKLLSVELSELLLSWERRRLKNESNKDMEETSTSVTPSGKRTAEPLAESSNKKLKSENTDNKALAISTSSTANLCKDYVPSLALRENIVGYLVRLACTVYNPSDIIQKRLVQRALELIRQFLDPSVWPDVNIKFIHLERTLIVKELNDILASSVCNALEILNIDISHKPNEWFIMNMNQLFRLLEASIKSDNMRIHTSLEPVLSHIFRAINSTINPEKGEETLHPDVSGFVSLVESTIADGMTSMHNIFGIFKLLQAFSTGRPEQLDPFVPVMVKMLQKLTKEYITSAHASSTAQESIVNLLILGLGVLKERVSYLGDQRRYFLTCLTQLIEKSPDIVLLQTIMSMVKEWTLNRTETFPTIKEKAGLLVKMMTIESRNNTQLTESFLDLVIKIYSDPSFACSELTVRLEQAFLFGTSNKNPYIRTQFMRVFDRSISHNLYTRLNYILGIQNWESLADTFWIHQALDMLFGAVKINPQISAPHTLKIKSIKSIGNQALEPTEMDVPNEVNEIINQHQSFLKALQEYDINNAISTTRYLQYLDDDTSFKLWIDLFPICWNALSGTEKHDMIKVIINLLAKEYHIKQVELRPNVIQALLTGIAKTGSGIKLPPHLVKYLGKTYNVWHTSIEILQQFTTTGCVNESSKDDINSKERTLDALCELYDELEERDMFYGLWRRRSTYTETNVAVSYEQSGMWSQAQTMYENAQTKARSGVLPFSESEYLLWEDHWTKCSQKLQQWDILIDLAKHDNNTTLLLDCAWRLSNWSIEREVLEQAISQVSATPTPRLKAMEAFLVLIKSQLTDDRLAEFNKVCEEGIQISLKKWYNLPHIVSQSHLPLLQIFQQYLELHETSQIFANLVNTNIQNFEQRSTELRNVLGSWRERMPNPWDDIDMWSDIVAWRQHIFNTINRTYMQLIPMIPPQLSQAALQGGNAFAYRGYHELGWILNRFAHVARKHHLNDICINNLTKLYTLPTIDTNEVFFKMREQIKCYYDDHTQLTAGLDIINNTNLSFFTVQQKAEFFGMKGQFLSKLRHYNEANEAFVNAVQMDLSLPGAWAEWGKYNDKRFKENPNDLSWANNAVSCYLQAAGIYKNAKARKYLLRVLWLLSLDDENGTVSRAFEGYKGDWPIWYWITFIPQLLMGLHQREAKHARAILMRIAKQFPQALYFQLRTAKEEMLKRVNMANISNISVDPAVKTESPAANISSNSTLSNTATATTNHNNNNTATNTSNDEKVKEDEDKEISKSEPVIASTKDTEIDEKVAEDSKDENSKSLVKDLSDKDNKENTMDIDEPSESKYEPNKSEEVKTEESKDTTEPALDAQIKTDNDLEKKDKVPDTNDSNTDVSITDSSTVNKTNPESVPGNKSIESKTSSPMIADTSAAANSNANRSISGTPVSATLHSVAHPLDEIMAMLKTGYPLLALSMETTVDQIQIKFKAQPDEDMYRVVVVLYNDGLRQLLSRLTNPDDTLQLTNTTISSIARFANSLYPGHLKAAFVHDFVSSKMNLEEYVAKLRIWRDKFEAMLHARPRKLKLESASRYLVEFQHQKFDDVEIPGQYLLLRDNANDFARIDRFLPEVEVTRHYNSYFRRLTIRGHDGSLHPFIIQNPSARQNRREERLMQLFRILNGVLERKKDSRIRNLGFHLPTIIPLAPNVRIIEDDPSYNTLYDIYEDYCDEVNMHKDYPLSIYVEKFKNSINKASTNAEQLNLKIEINEDIGKKLVPSNILSKYMLRTLNSYTDYWMHHKRFTTQYATITFMCYLFNIENRLPHKITISSKTGNICMTGLHLGWNQTSYMLSNEDAVPFRFTPNIQDYITPVGIEGPFSSSLMATARSLTEPELELDQYISLFIRDDLISWHTAQPYSDKSIQYRELVQTNVLQIMAKAQLLACRTENKKELRSDQPVNQNIIDLISQASNPQNIANMDCTWMPWL